MINKEYFGVVLISASIVFGFSLISLSLWNIIEFEIIQLVSFITLFGSIVIMTKIGIEMYKEANGRKVFSKDKEKDQ